MVDYNGLENRRTERYRGFESLSLRNKKDNIWLSFFCCGCEPGSHVLSVASLCESVPSGRARIPLSPQQKGQHLVVLFLLRMRAGFSGSADLRLSGSHVLSEISDYTSSLIFTTLFSSKPTVGFFAKGLSECGISNR